MTTATKTQIAIVTVNSQAARECIEEYACVDWIGDDNNSFTVDRLFLAEIIEILTDDDLAEGRDFDIIYK